MKPRQESKVAAVFESVVRPKPYIPEEKIDALAALFESPAYCKAFIEETRGNDGLSANDLTNGREQILMLECFEQSPNPKAKSIIKNILLHGREEGGVLNHWDGNRFVTARLIQHLDPQDRKEVLCKPYMISDLVDCSYYHWNDKAVVDMIDQYDPGDRLDILCAPDAVNALLNGGKEELRADVTWPKVRAWFEEQPAEGKKKILESHAAARGFMQAFGMEGLDIVKAIIPPEELKGVFARRQDLSMYMQDKNVAHAYLASLPEADRESFFEDGIFYPSNKWGFSLYGSGLRASHAQWTPGGP